MALVELTTHIFLPPSKEVRDTRLREHKQKVEKVAYSLYERRRLKAPENPYDQTLLEQVPPHELARRDYLLATGLVNDPSPVGLELLDQDLARLRAKNEKRLEMGE